MNILNFYLLLIFIFLITSSKKKETYYFCVCAKENNFSVRGLTTLVVPSNTIRFFILYF